jgi:hypothetical protein
MLALAVTCTETRRNVTFADPPADLVDPQSSLVKHVVVRAA